LNRKVCNFRDLIQGFRYRRYDTRCRLIDHLCDRFHHRRDDFVDGVRDTGQGILSGSFHLIRGSFCVVDGRGDVLHRLRNRPNSVRDRLRDTAQKLIIKQAFSRGAAFCRQRRGYRQDDR